MIYFNNALQPVSELNVFGAGELFTQFQPHLTKSKIKLLNIFDDTLAAPEHDIERYIQQGITCPDLLFCVGYKNMPERFRRFNKLKELGFRLLSFVDDHVTIPESSRINNGTLIKQSAVIDDFINIGECSFVNIGATISHHSQIGDNVYISPGVNICGYVRVHEGSFIGANATIIDHIVVGDYAVVAAGAVVIEDVPAYSMVAGNPAVIKKAPGEKVP